MKLLLQSHMQSMLSKTVAAEEDVEVVVVGGQGEGRGDDVAGEKETATDRATLQA